jgi:hypothetical protein
MIANKDAIIKEKDEKIKELELALEKNKP